MFVWILIFLSPGRTTSTFSLIETWLFLVFLDDSDEIIHLNQFKMDNKGPGPI